MNKLELVFVPVSASGHLASSIKFAKLLIDQNERLSITFVVILLPNQTDLHPDLKSLAASDSRIRFTTISPAINPTPISQPTSPISIEKFANTFFETHKSHVETAVNEMVSDDSTQLLGFVLDMFSSCIIDVANKFKVPSYILFTSNISFLGFLLHLPNRHNRIGVGFHESDADSIVPSYKNPIPTDVLPGAALDQIGGGYEAFLYNGTKMLESKGIIVNSFVELEPFAADSIVSPAPTVYPVGPLLNLKNRNESDGSIAIKNWLDNQPPKSVLFLCFGSMGSFDEPQLEQIAMALEKSDHRFLWSVRQPPPPESAHGSPTDYTNVAKVLPDGFLEKTKERGMVCGWAPQVEVLAHGAVKGFVSHCGWNSILESLWFGVPIATWPLSAEQQLNAFWLVRELGLGVELSLTYRSGGGCELMMKDKIAKAIDCLMDDENPVRERVKDISEKSRKAVIKGGSSFVTLEKLIQDMIQNIG